MMLQAVDECHIYICQDEHRNINNQSWWSSKRRPAAEYGAKVVWKSIIIGRASIGPWINRASTSPVNCILYGSTASWIWHGSRIASVAGFTQILGLNSRAGLFYKINTKILTRQKSVRVGKFRWIPRYTKSTRIGSELLDEACGQGLHTRGLCILGAHIKT